MIIRPSCFKATVMMLILLSATSYQLYIFFWSVSADKPWQCSPHCHLGSGSVSDCADFTGPGLHFGISSSDSLIREDWLPPPRVRKVTAAHRVPEHVGKIDEVSWRWIAESCLSRCQCQRLYLFILITSPGGRLMRKLNLDDGQHPAQLEIKQNA